MRRISELLCFCFFLLYFEAISSDTRSNVTGKEMVNLWKTQSPPPTTGADFNETIVSLSFLKCSGENSCAGRCSFNRQFHEPKEEISKCFCDSWCDTVFHDCCEDYDKQCNASFMKENLPRNELDDLWTCGRVDMNKHKIWTIGKCERGWKDEEIATKCMHPDGIQISTQIPVIDSNNVTFLNRYCAICNGISVYKPWNFKVKCNVFLTNVYTEEEYWKFIDSFCPIEFLDRTFPARGIRHCYNVIKTCKRKATDRQKKNCAENPTGLVAQCQWFSFENYRNLDCFTCNNGRWIIAKCGPQLPRKSPQGMNIPRPYSAIFTTSDSSFAASSSRCPDGEIYNARSGRCNELLAADSAKTSQEFLKTYAVVLTYEATDNRSSPASKHTQCSRFRDVFEKLLKVSIVELNLKFSDLTIHKQSNSSFVVTFRVIGLKQDFENGGGVPTDYTKINKFIFHASSNQDISYGICRYALTRQLAREMFCAQNITFIAANMSRTIFLNGTLKVSHNQTQTSYYNEDEYFKYNESFFGVCKEFKPSNCSYYNVVQNTSDLILFRNRSIYSHVTQSVFDYGEYAVINFEIWICLRNDLILNANRIAVPSVSIHQTVLSYMTLAALFISVSSLVAVIVVYSLNRSLRNLPGKNLMLLCGTIATAQTLWLIERNFSSMPVVCTVTAILSHFSFLSSFCTSGSIAINSFLTFRRLSGGKLYGSNKRREFLLYCGYSLGLPGLWVTLCWILHACQVISLRNESSNSCWFGTAEGLEIAFLFPAATQLLVNIVLLGIALRHIRKCSNASRELQTKKKGTNSRHVGIYLRMSALMGLSWLFGTFVVAFPGEVIFEYLFVFGNGFQGLYIAIAFLWTKNVKKIMTKRLTKRTTKSASHSLPESEKTRGYTDNVL